MSLSFMKMQKLIDRFSNGFLEGSAYMSNTIYHRSVAEVMSKQGTVQNIAKISLR